MISIHFDWFISLWSTTITTTTTTTTMIINYINDLIIYPLHNELNNFN